jgi:hypothetical protein
MPASEHLDALWDGAAGRSGSLDNAASADRIQDRLHYRA